MDWQATKPILLLSSPINCCPLLLPCLQTVLEAFRQVNEEFSVSLCLTGLSHLSHPPDLRAILKPALKKATGLHHFEKSLFLPLTITISKKTQLLH